MKYCLYIPGTSVPLVYSGDLLFVKIGGEPQFYNSYSDASEIKIMLESGITRDGMKRGPMGIITEDEYIILSVVNI